MNETLIKVHITFSVLLLSLQNILKCMKADSVSGIEMI